VTRRPLGEGEASLGLPANPRRAPQARPPHLRHLDPDDPAGRRSAPLPHGALVRTGSNSSGLKRKGSWPVTSSQWRRPGFGPFACSSLSRWEAAGWCGRGQRPAPDAGWVAQQARNLLLTLPEGDAPRFLVRDRDAKYGGACDEVFRAEGTRVIRTPVRAPRANAHAERWVRTVRAECLDHMLILSRRHLDSVVAEYVEHYNTARPHRSLGLAAPARRTSAWRSRSPVRVASTTCSPRRPVPTEGSTR